VSSLSPVAEDPDTDDIVHGDSKQGSHDKKKGKVIGNERSYDAHDRQHHAL
jgi:hypothetical protein